MDPGSRRDAAQDGPPRHGAEHVGPYTLVRPLGRGGMAEAFEAVRRSDSGIEQRVCLKRTLPALEQDPEFLALFLREAKVSASLRHVNVASVLDFGESDGRHFLVLELVDGTDLRRLLRSPVRAGSAEPSTGDGDAGTLPPELVVLLAIELASALDYAHAARPDGQVEGVVHRDISPSNVLLGTHGEVKLADFGVAKAVNSPQLTRTGGIKGKLPYMAPEYARGGVYDARSDLFSLGVLLYECAAGRRPFDGKTEVETLERAHSGEHVPVSELVPGLPTELADSIEALIAREPSARPPTAAALLDRLPPVNPRARLELGALVRAARERESDAEQIAREATVRASEGGTVAACDSERVAPWVLDSAAKDAVTRTRLRQEGLDSIPERPANGSEDGEAPHREPLTRRDGPSTDGAGHDGATVTRAARRAPVDASGERRAPAPPEDLPSEPGLAPEADGHGGRPGRRRARRLGVWALTVTIALAALWALWR